MNRVVYDSDHGRTTCDRCGRVHAKCRCPQSADPAIPQSDGVVRIRREVRRGKPTTVVIGLPLDEAGLKELAKALKKKCSTGGSAKAGNIEIQGDHRDLLRTELESRGYLVKFAGG